MLKSTYTPPPPLPPGWTEHRAPTGHLYFYNTVTKQSTYTRPVAQTPQTAPTGNEVSPAAPAYSPETLPPFSSTPYAPAGYQPGTAQYGQLYSQNNHGRGGFRGGKGYQDRGRREPQDRPKSKHAIPDCGPWVLVKTKLGRRFVHNPETNESFWKFPQEVLKAVTEFDRVEREKKARIERGEEPEEQRKAETPKARPSPSTDDKPASENRASLETPEGAEDSEEYEEVEVTDSEDEENQPSKRARTDSEGAQNQPVEFTEEDMEYQLAAMGEEYGLDPGEYGELGEEDWETQGLPLTEADAEALFRDLLDDYNINPFTTWEKIIEEGRIIEDSRYTAPSNMKTRREIFSSWSKDRAKDVQERKKNQEKQDPRIKYLAFLQEHATPKLYWPEFKRKFRKEPEMKDSQLHDKDREKFYRDYISRLKASESTRKSDLSALLKSAPVHALNQSSTLETLPTVIITDVRYIALPPRVRDPLIEAYISTLPPAPEVQLTAEEQEELERKRREREKREKALAEREKRVEEDKRRQRFELVRGKHLLREGEAEIAEAMRIKKDGLRTHMELDEAPASEQDKASQ
ncbi:WW/Rsp5/WWP [Penicillium longicatenatum]|uniref:WW/Rsp5/WWP n=1 Tax=Penicillium longicatenatum TaxID=1561947 RepID=UPI0025475F72|nr:WW/Rsp5/WWP [Penicillium longicatenatum]KAJ5650503.1 WW/Rsp5/WWP [Penicillium longicatenatum]